MHKQLSTIFSKSRAEQNPDDLWGNFVLPLHYPSYNLLSFTRGNRIVGARGSGKTTYLKYHCYPTQLSKNREGISQEDIEQIGIYWKPDTTYTRQMNEDYLGEEWRASFNTYCALSLLAEYSKLIQHLIESNYEDISVKTKLNEYIFPSEFKEVLGYKDEELSYKKLSSYCRGRKLKLSSWVNGYNMESKPDFLPGKEVLTYAINDLLEQGLLKNITIHVFIDEFENFTYEQQKIINTWMKHGEVPLLFSVAFKKYSTITSHTIGDQKLEERDDYKKIDIIEDVYAKEDKSFNVLASEVIALKVQEFLTNGEEYVNVASLSSLESISERSSNEYQQRILSFTQTLFPSQQYGEIALSLLNDPVLSKRLISNIDYALKLKKSSLKAEDFIDIRCPSASISNSAILYRNKTIPDQLLKKFKDCIKNEKPDAQYREQISNTLVGTILYIYTSYAKRICPIFSGFDAFSGMAKNNLRHLLELCHQSFIELEVANNHTLSSDILPIVPIELQTKAAKNSSVIELERMPELGKYGEDLQKIAYRLGKIFTLKQEIKSQSEPEVIHFAIKVHSVKALSEEIQTLLNAAKKWNVLIEFDETKNKDITDISTKEWMLTPMMAPYFTITYRKIRKIIFSVSEIETIFIKGDLEFKSLHLELIKRWNLNNEHVPSANSLFGDML